MKLYIKNMVSIRCKNAVKAELRKLGLHFIVDLGVADVMEDITGEQRDLLRTELLKSGLELFDHKKALLIEKIKKVIVEMVYNTSELPKKNISEYLSSTLDMDYSYMANLFSEAQGITIEKYFIAHKIERIKEMIIYDDLNLTDIAWKLQYSSVAHLSNQFKKNTGFSPTHFKQLKMQRLKTIEES